MLYNIYLVLYFVGIIVGLFFIFRKAGEAPWKALIPIYNIVVWIKICGKDWKWYLYFLVPAINIFTFLLLVVETAKAFRRYGFWEQLLAILMPWAYLSFLGLSPKMTYSNPKEIEPHKVSVARDWLDTIVFAVVAAVIIRGNVAELYNIPSSSMEKTLLVGDYTLVSKYSYGPRVTMTPLAVPLVHNVLPGTGGQVESYLKWIQLPYHRYPGLGKVERYDAVVFNYPDGDTMCSAQFSNRSYYDLVRHYGREAVWNDRVYDPYYGRIPIGKIRVRPLDKRENFIKRCVGLPGEDLQIIDQQLYINGNRVDDPAHLQFTYIVQLNSKVADPRHFFDALGVSNEDFDNASYMASEYATIVLQYETHKNAAVRAGITDSLYQRARTYRSRYELPMTREMAARCAAMEGVDTVYPQIYAADDMSRDLFPHDGAHRWSIDNYGPIHIPAAGEVLHLDSSNIAIYQRLISSYEHNEVEVRDGKIYINGEETTQYTVKQDYFWMMGDNRHNSADSRYWGFVPEDHVLGKFLAVLYSIDKDHGGIRWNRCFKAIKSL